MQVLLQGIPAEFLGHRNVPEGSRLFASSLVGSGSKKRATPPPKSLVIDDVKADLCEAIAAKMLEVTYCSCGLTSWRRHLG